MAHKSGASSYPASGGHPGKGQGKKQSGSMKIKRDPITKVLPGYGQSRVRDPLLPTDMTSHLFQRPSRGQSYG